AWSGVTPDAPLAISRTVSLVDMQPSVSSRSKVTAVADRSAASSRAGGRAASVVGTHSMVARAGAVIPAPLAIPPVEDRSPGGPGARGGRAGGDGAAGVVGGRAARGAGRVEGRRGGRPQRRVERGRGEVGVGGEHAQHGGGAGGDHPRSLGHPADGVSVSGGSG